MNRVPPTPPPSSPVHSPPSPAQHGARQPSRPAAQAQPSDAQRGSPVAASAAPTAPRTPPWRSLALQPSERVSVPRWAPGRPVSPSPSGRREADILRITSGSGRNLAVLCASQTNSAAYQVDHFRRPPAFALAASGATFAPPQQRSPQGQTGQRRSLTEAFGAETEFFSRNTRRVRRASQQTTPNTPPQPDDTPRRR